MKVENRKASYEYYIEDKLECGISLRGNEVKSIRLGAVNISDAWCQIQDKNLVVRGMFISGWSTSNTFDVDERRGRQLLAHRKEIEKLASRVAEKGVSLIPLEVYFVNGRCKVLVGICKGKKLYDKRSSLKEKQVKRDISREFKEVRRKEQ